MKVVMYSPWPNQSFVSDATNYVNGANRREHKPGKQKVYSARARGARLQDLTVEDRLYVLGHGIDSMELIMADVDTPWKAEYEALGFQLYRNKQMVECTALKPKGLFDQLVAEGLPETFNDIRLWVCKAGDASFTRFGLEFTARMLKRNVGAQVTAYKGFMVFRPNSGRKRGQLDKSALESDPASVHKTLLNRDPTFTMLQEIGAYDDL